MYGIILYVPLQRAHKDGYVNITGSEGKRKIEYIPSERYKENYEGSEKKVRANSLQNWFINMNILQIKVEMVVLDRLPTDRTDIVIFSDNECIRPYAVAEKIFRTKNTAEVLCKKAEQDGKRRENSLKRNCWGDKMSNKCLSYLVESFLYSNECVEGQYSAYQVRQIVPELQRYRE